MVYSGVYVFGDSLVDAGNALKLAQTYNYFPFTSLPNGAPTTAKGYFQGRFTDGWTFADLISNKYLSVPTKTVFPYGYDEPFLGISFDFFSDPNGNNLNFAYGGAQIRQGDEAVPDSDDQTDAYRDAVDGDADPNALHMFVFGANDIHDLVPRSGAWASWSTAFAALSRAADELIEEVLQTIEIGARHILITGVPDVGIQPDYNGTDNEAARRAVATEYAAMLDAMIQQRLGELQIEGVTITYVDWSDLAGTVLGTMVGLYGESQIYPLNFSDEVFMDDVHPTAQVHALAAAYMIDLLNGTPAGEQSPLTAADFSMNGLIGTIGEADTITISLAAGATYTFEMLGISSLGGNYLVLADPMIRVFGPDGTLVVFNDDGGIGLDSALTFTAGAAGDYTIQLTGVGSLTGSYVFQADGQAAGNNNYTVSHSNALILESVGGGLDTVRASVSYALNAGSEVETLRTTNDRGKGSINLTGNEFAQAIIGNSGNNILEGKGGADVFTGGSGKDVFVLSNTAVTNPDGSNVDRITDYGAGDIVDISQILNVAAGTNVVSGGYIRVTTSGLIQVDIDGGGNNWVTLSQINGSGSVTLRYVSGGALTSVSVSRVSATSAPVMASSVAAAGVAAMAAEPETSNQSGAEQFASAGLVMSAGIASKSFMPTTHDGGLDVGGHWHSAIAGQALARHSIFGQEWQSPADLAEISALAPVTAEAIGSLPEGSQQPSNDAHPAAMPAALTVAMPSAQLLQSEMKAADANSVATQEAESRVAIGALGDVLEDAIIDDLLLKLVAEGPLEKVVGWDPGEHSKFAESPVPAALANSIPEPLIEMASLNPDMLQPV